MKLPPRLDSGQIQRLFDCGQLLSGKTLKLIWCRNAGDPTGISYISPKRLGKACIRNRLRRLIRESLAASSMAIPEHLMLAFIARQNLLNMELAEIQSEMLSLMSRLPLDLPPPSQSS